MNKLYLVSAIERNIDEGPDFYTDFRLFYSEKDADNAYSAILDNFISQMKDVRFDDCFMGDGINTFTWNDGGCHWEIQKAAIIAQ